MRSLLIGAMILTATTARAFPAVMEGSSLKCQEFSGLQQRTIFEGKFKLTEYCSGGDAGAGCFGDYFFVAGKSNLKSVFDSSVSYVLSVYSDQVDPKNPYAMAFSPYLRLYINDYLASDSPEINESIRRPFGVKHPSSDLRLECEVSL